MKANKHVDVPPLLPCLEQRGMGKFLDEAFADIVWQNRDNIHEMVDAVIAQNQRRVGKGGRKAMKSSGGGGGPAYTNRDPKIEPPANAVRHQSVTARASRSDIEPILERQDSSATVAGMFEKAAAECRAAVAAIVKDCRAQRKMFFDDSFYYDKKRNLYPKGSPDDCTVTEPLKTKRLRDLYPNAPVFADGLDCDDVVQGSVGDCFLIGAISSLAAANAKQLKGLFVAHDLDCGVYGLCFFKCGGWEWVIVDDNVAVVEERSGYCYPLYATAGQDAELWPMVLEKAYAKVHYNWDIIDGGFAKEALVDLTGGLSSTYDFYRTHKNMGFKAFRAEVDDPNTVLGCAVGDHVEEDDAASGSAGEAGAVYGLFHGHQYSVVGAIEASDGTGFVRVRNPWGNDAEWTGPYADNAPEWKQNPQHKRELKPEFKDDGAFWMKWDDFRKYMTQVDVVRTFPQNYKVLTMFDAADKSPSPNTAYILQVADATTKLALTFMQDDPKVKFNSEDHGSQYTPYNSIKMSIYKLNELPKDESDFERCLGTRMESLRVRERSVYTRADFEPGYYCITPVMGTGPNRGSFVRIVGPPDSDYALWRWRDGESSRLVVGKVPVRGQTRRPPSGSPASVAAVAAPAPTTPQRTPPHPNAIASPIRTGTPQAPAGVARSQSPTAGASSAEVAMRRELEEQKEYVKQLERLLKKQQEQLDAAQDVVARSPGGHIDPKARLGMPEDRYEEVVGEVFAEVSRGQRTIEPKAAINALRLVLTLGAGMDTVAAQQRVIAAGEPVDAQQFRSLCDNVVNNWEVLN